MSNEPKHTPGPLYVDSVAAPMSHNGDVAVVNSKRTLIALAYLRPADGEALANARLIAAAPELLAACKAADGWLESFRGHLEEFGTNEDEKNISDVIRQMLAAIAKAEGGAQ